MQTVGVPYSVELGKAIYIIKDHLTLSNNDDISEIATIIVCYLSDLAIDNQTDIFKNFNGENERNIIYYIVMIIFYC